MAAKLVLGKQQARTSNFTADESFFADVAAFINATNLGTVTDDANDTGNLMRTVAWDTVDSQLLDSEGNIIEISSDLSAGCGIAIVGDVCSIDTTTTGLIKTTGAANALEWVSDGDCNQLSVKHDSTLTIDGSNRLSVVSPGSASYIRIKGSATSNVDSSDSTFTIDGVTAISGSSPGASVTVKNDPPIVCSDNDTVYAMYDDSAGSGPTSDWTTADAGNFALLMKGWAKESPASYDNDELQYLKHTDTGTDDVAFLWINAGAC